MINAVFISGFVVDSITTMQQEDTSGYSVVSLSLQKGGAFGSLRSFFITKSCAKV